MNTTTANTNSTFIVRYVDLTHGFTGEVEVVAMAALQARFKIEGPERNRKVAVIEVTEVTP